MIVPMVPRLDEESQKTVNAGWERMLSPVDRLDDQTLLDAIIVTGLFQQGVDRVHFRSEKRFSGGMVVMEVHFDRTMPTQDRFEISVLGPGGKTLRTERYDRKAVEDTYQVLFGGPRAKKIDGDKPERADTGSTARWERIHKLFPQLKCPPDD